MGAFGAAFRFEKLLLCASFGRKCISISSSVTGSPRHLPLGAPGSREAFGVGYTLGKAFFLPFLLLSFVSYNKFGKSIVRQTKETAYLAFPSGEGGPLAVDGSHAAPLPVAEKGAGGSSVAVEML